MPKVPIYIVDAFADRVFSGNPAAVCPLQAWLPDAVMQQIAAENNLAETAFLVRAGETIGLRWFTPAIEVDLCGHATLASAHVLFRHLGYMLDTIRFTSRSGPLEVTNRHASGRLTLHFPTRAPTPIETPGALARGLRATPRATLRSRDLLAVFDSEAEVHALRPDFVGLERLDCLGVIATAPGDSVDFVSRFFAPAAGINEDPVTGSAHCTLIPYWAERLGKTELQARQISRRGGYLWCELAGERVRISGHAVTYLVGEISV